MVLRPIVISVEYSVVSTHQLFAQTRTPDSNSRWEGSSMGETGRDQTRPGQPQIRSDQTSSKKVVTDRLRMQWPCQACLRVD